MKLRWNAFLYLGFLVVLLTFPSYFLFFARFPITRDFPWINLLLFALGLGLLGVGLLRVYKKPDQYRGKIVGPIFSVISALIIAFFLFFTFSFAKRLPASKGAPQVGQKAPDFTLPDRDGNPVTLSKLWGTSVTAPATGHADQWVLMIFYRGYWWPFCNSELRSFQDQLDQFKARGVQIVAISVDPPGVTRDYCRKQGYTYTFLSDERLEAVLHYDLLHQHGGPEGDIARPAEFLVDSTGTIRWENLTEDYRVRARPEQVLAALDQFGRKPSGD